MWRKILQSTAATAVLLFGFDRSVGYAAIFGADQRVYVPAAPGSPFSPVGLIGKGRLLARYATGTLVDPCHVLTSQHIFGARLSPIGGRVKFVAGFGTLEQASSGGTVIAAGRRENYPSPNEQYQAVGHDWMLVRLDKCLGTTFGYAKLRAWPHGENDLSNVQSLGYPIDRDRRSGVTLDPSCKIRGVYSLVWLNDCAAMPGNSGGPLFRFSSSGGSRMEIFAIQSTGYGKGMTTAFWLGNANRATPVSMILPYIQQYLRWSVSKTP